MNHIDDKAWEDNLEEITLHGVNHDIHLERNPNLIRANKITPPQDTFNVQLEDKLAPEDILQMGIEEEIASQMGNENMQQSTLSEEQQAIIDEGIKRRGAKIAKANMIKSNDEFVQVQVDEVLQQIAAVKAQDEAQREAKEEKKRQQ